MLLIIIFIALFLSFSITGLVTPLVLWVTSYIAKANNYELNYITLAKRSFWVAWAINSCLYFFLSMNYVAFSGMNAFISPWTMVVCSIVVIVVIYINYQNLKEPYNEEEVSKLLSQTIARNHNAILSPNIIKNQPYKN